MAKKRIYSFQGSDLITCRSAIKSELAKPDYTFYASYEQTLKTYHIVGTTLAELFVKNMLTLITKLRLEFEDKESVNDFNLDETFLKSLLKKG